MYLVTKKKHKTKSMIWLYLAFFNVNFFIKLAKQSVLNLYDTFKKTFSLVFICSIDSKAISKGLILKMTFMAS